MARFENFWDLIFTYGEILPGNFLKKANVKVKHAFYDRAIKKGTKKSLEKVERMENIGGGCRLIYLINGLKIKCKEEDDAVIDTLCGGDNVRIFDNIQGIIFDLGAHIGGFCLNAALYPNVKHVYAFEPGKESYNLLVENIKLNSLESIITPVNKAIWSHSKGIYFKKTGVSATYQANEQGEEKIETATLKEAMQGITLVDILKIDVEGSEYEIFKTLGDDFKKIKVIIGEYHCDRKEGNYFNLLKFLKPYYRNIKHFSPSSFLALN